MYANKQQVNGDYMFTTLKRSQTVTCCEADVNYIKSDIKSQNSNTILFQYYFQGGTFSFTTVGFSDYCCFYWMVRKWKYL